MNIAIGSDHAGYALKQTLIQHLQEHDYTVLDLGTNSEQRADYPDFGHAVATAITNEEAPLGIVICGSGNGINMSVNKHPNLRSALCWSAEIAKLARAHNNANVLALPARFINATEAKACVEAFLNTPFEGGRHQDRVQKINIQ